MPYDTPFNLDDKISDHVDTRRIELPRDLSLPTEIRSLIESYCNWTQHAILVLSIKSADCKCLGQLSVPCRIVYITSATIQLYKVWRYGGYFLNCGVGIQTKQEVCFEIRLIRDDKSPIRLRTFHI